MPVFHQLQHIVALSKIEFFETPIVQQKDIGFSQLCNELGEATVMMCYRECFE